MTFLGIPLDFISEFFDMYFGLLISLPLVFISAQTIIYKNLCLFEYSIVYKIYDFGQELVVKTNDSAVLIIYALFIFLVQVLWIAFLNLTIYYPHFFSLLVFAFGVMCILPFLNLVSVRKMNKKLFLRKLAND